MTFNGKNVGDSQICIEMLADKLKKSMNPGMSESDQAISSTFQVMIEDRLIPCLELGMWPMSSYTNGFKKIHAFNALLRFSLGENLIL